MNKRCNSLPGLLLEAVENYPGRIAVRDSVRSVTYQELYRLAVGVSDRLATRVGAGSRVVCITRKDAESLICFWGVLFCGAIPVLLDQEDGVKVNIGKIRSAEADAIIGGEDFSEWAPHVRPASFFHFNDLISPLTGNGPVSPKPVHFPEACYNLLTSGTSGNPKIVQISHYNVLHYTYSVYERIGSPERVNAAHVSTFAADLGMTNILMALVSGGMLRILSRDEASDPAVFCDILNRDEINLLKITPSHLASLLIQSEMPLGRPIRHVLLGGEKLSWKMVGNIFSGGICTHLYNHYGPSETTIGALMFKIERGSPHFNRSGSVPIGTPIGEGRGFIEEAADDTGELLIAGPGVGLGYYNNRAGTDKRFVTRRVDGVDMPCYKTGDICRKLEDGNFEFLFRTDRQVKVSGYRVELGEIEMLLATHPEVENAVVTTGGREDHLVIEAYIKVEKGTRPDAAGLKQWLLEKLPRYKIPAVIQFYDEAPYNSNGKLDLNALRSRLTGGSPAEDRPGRQAGDGDWASLVEMIWKKVLNRNHVLQADNFFETGGDSLLAIQFIGTLQRHGYKIHITDINRRPLFGDFCGLRPELSQQIKPDLAGSRTDNGLTWSQRQFVQRMELNQDEYCQSILLESETPIRLREMALACNLVMSSHLQLTTAFGDRVKPNLSEGELPAFTELGTCVLDSRESTAMQIQQIGKLLLKEISLEKAQLFRARVIIDPAGKEYMYLVCHHMAIDVISWNIILDELFEYYQEILNGRLPVIIPENTVMDFYQEISRRVGEARQTGVLPEEEIVHIPVPEIRNVVPAAASVLNIVVPPEMSQTLNRLDETGRAFGLSGFLLSAFLKALFREMGLTKLSVDIEFHGRPHLEGLPDLSRSVAWWALSTPVTLNRDQLDPEACSILLENEAKMASEMNVHANGTMLSKRQRPDVLFNYLGRFPQQFGNASIRMKPSNFNAGPVRSWTALQDYKISFTGRFIGNTLMIDIQYQPSVFSETSMANIAELFDREFFSPGLFAVESNLPSAGQPLYHINANGPVIRKKEKKTIFLTGATGFLGSHLLYESARRGQAEIYCLVRGKNQADAESRLENSLTHFFRDMRQIKPGTIKVLQGDLLNQNFGLDRAVYENISEKADIILHAAADVNLITDYSGLFHTNIGSTSNIVELADHRKKKELHYISSLAVSGMASGQDIRDFSETDFEYGQFFISDYERSKFEGEKIVRSFLQSGGRGTIYRVGHIAADSKYGRFQRNSGQNRIFQIIKGILLLKKIPATFSEKVSFSYVDIVAKCILNVLFEGAKTSLDCFHMENPHGVSFLSIAGMLGQMGYKIELVDLEEFKRTVEDFQGDRNEKNAVELMYNWIQRGIEFPRKVRYLQKRSLDLSASSGLYFPKLSLDWLSRMIREGVDSGYFYSPSPMDNSVQPELSW